MNKVLLHKEVLELKREQKLGLLILIFLFLVAFSVMTTKWTPKLLELMLPEMDPEKSAVLSNNLKDPTIIEYVSVFHKNLTQIGLIIIALAFNDNITKEISNKSIYNLLSLGIRRKGFIVTKSITMSIFVVGLLLVANISFLVVLLILGIEVSIQEFFTLLIVLVSKYLLLTSILTMTSVLTLKGWSAALSALGIYALFNLLAFIPKFKYVIPFHYWKGHEPITIRLLVIGLMILIPWIIISNLYSVYILKRRDI